MKSLYILLSILFFSSLTLAEAGSCELCARVDKLLHEVENEDDKKAYEEFEKLMMTTTELSADAKIREQEMDSLVKGTVGFLPHDDQESLPDFLLTISKKYPKEFEKSSKALSRDDQKKLEERMKISAGIRAEGEGFSDPDKKLDEIEAKKKKGR